MSNRLLREALEHKAIVRDELVTQPPVDRSFEMPTGLYAATAGLYLAFVTIMCVGLSSPGLILPFAIFAIFITGMFGVPAIWTRLTPDTQAKPLTHAALMQGGIATHTGRLPGRDAAVQMLILPVLIVAWGIAIVTIAALVGV